MNALFHDRIEAAGSLARRLGKYAGLGTIVLGVDRGATMLAAELAARLMAPFDLLPVQPFELPCEGRAPIGAVAPGGACVLDDELVDLLEVEADAIGMLRSGAEAALEQQNLILRGLRPLPRLDGRTVVLVEELVACTLRVRAALLCLRQRDPHGIVLAAAVATETAVHELRPLVNELVILETRQSAPPIDCLYACADAPCDADVRRVLGFVDPQPEIAGREAMND
jgi:putative phosphoribosyl transferase